jgi:acetoin utilization deacetylase AcuC-like enzyme
MNVAFLSHPECVKHPAIAGHPECPGRLTVIEESLMEQGIYDFLRLELAPQATIPQLEQVHTARHIERILNGLRKAELNSLMRTLV